MKYCLALIVISLIALWPFFKEGYFESHDGEWMVIRFSAFHQTLANGQFPVRFVDRLNNNYGYPVLNFLYPLPFYFSEIPKLLGLGFTDSIKITFVITTVFSTLAMFWALSGFFTRTAALTGAIVYLFTPYRFVDLYVRGSLGENMAFAAIPLVLGSIFKIARGDKRFFYILSISVAVLILSHNVIAILFLPLLFLISITLSNKEIIKTTGAFALGMLMSAFFWLPALYDLQFVKFSQAEIANIATHLVPIKNLIYPSWGFGPSPTGQNHLSTQLGLVSLAIFSSAIYTRIKDKHKPRVIDLILLAFVVSSFLMTSVALPIWEIPYLDTIQFPWRLLSIVVFASAFLAAYIVSRYKNVAILAPLIILASLTSTIVYTYPANFVNRGDGFYSTNEDSTTVKNEYLPLWVKEQPKERASSKIEVEGDAIIENTKIKAANYSANITLSKESKVLVNTIYFPGWQAKSNGQKLKIDYQNAAGLITFTLPKGSHKVVVDYGKTQVHFVAELVSLVALLGAGGLLYLSWRRQNS